MSVPDSTGTTEPAAASGTVYYGAFDDDDNPLGLFRLLKDDSAQTLTLERITADGSWVDDPSLVDELHEPEVRIITADEAQQVIEELTARRDAEAEADTPPPPPGTPPMY